MATRQQWLRRALTVCSALYTILFVGAIFGWGPMQLLLEEHGSFRSKCDDGIGVAVCPAQTKALLNVSWVAMLTQVLSLPLGWIVDRWGARTMALLMIVFHTLGMGMVILAVAKNMDWLLYPAFSIVAIHTWMGGMLTVQIGLFFQSDRIRLIVTSVQMSMWDASGVTYWVLWAIYKEFLSGESLTTLLTGYYVLSLVVFGIAGYLWAVTEPEEPLTVEDEKAESSQSSTHSAGEEEQDKDEAEGGGGELVLGVDYIRFSERPARQQLVSIPMLLITMFVSIHTVSSQWMTTTARDFLAELGDDEVGNRYLTAFTLLTPLSVVGLVFIDQLILRFGYHGGFQFVNVLALVWLLLRVFSDDLRVQVVGFVAFTFFRNALFSISFSFLAVFMAERVLGKAQGIIFTLAAILSYINIPLTRLAVETLGSFTVPDIIWAVLVAPCIVAAWWLGRIVERDQTLSVGAVRE